MELLLQEVKLYENFDELSKDVLVLAKEIMPDKLIYINYLSDTQQVTLKTTEDNSKIMVTEGMVIPLEKGLCHLVDYKHQKPLIYEDIQKETSLKHLKDSFDRVNINAYLGIPITLHNSERFGTLCTADYKATTFDERSIALLQKLAKMFTYYLEMERIAYRDTLTGLHNRHYLYRYFESYPKTYGTLFLLDLDGFKYINDTFGHDMGDQVLIEASFKLNQVLKPYPNAYATRLGGDEFVVFIPELTEERLLKRIANEIIMQLREWDLPIEKARVSSSIGITTFNPADRGPLKKHLKKADNALYKAKNQGKNRYIYER